MKSEIVILLMAVVLCVQSKPLDIYNDETAVEINPIHNLIKRFINPSWTAGSFSAPVVSNIRAKRSAEEECEKLELCKLHARSNRNFLAAFQLYFVNKENAHLWDHQSRSLEECDERYSCYR